MPKKVEECVKEVQKQRGVSEDEAWAICQEKFGSDDKTAVETRAKKRRNEKYVTKRP